MTNEDLAAIEKMVANAVEGIETKLAASLGNTIEGINNKVDLAVDLNVKSKAALEAMPSLVKEQIESQLKTNLTDIVEEVRKQLEAKVAQAGGGSPAGGGMGIRDLLAESDKVVGIINAFRSPTTEQAMLSQMSFVMKWHALLSKLEKGGGAPDDLTKAIASTFTSEKE